MTITEPDLAIICSVVHEAIRTYVSETSGRRIPSWPDAPDWMKEASRDSVRFVLEYPTQDPREHHENWRERKISEGWRYGSERDVSKKTHPNLVPFRDLPLTARRKDSLVIAIVNALAPSSDS